MSQDNKKIRQLANVLVCPLCQFGLKNTFLFFFWQKLPYFTTKNDANKLKRNVFSKTAIESAEKPLDPVNTQCSP